MKDKDIENLPTIATEYIDSVIKKMGYRKKVRADVRAELTAHFEDALKDCETDEQRTAKAQDLITDFGDIKTLAKLIRRGKKRCRPLCRTIIARSFQLTGLLIMFLIIQIIFFITGKPDISIDYMARFNQLVKPEVDQTQNAAPFYLKAAELSTEAPDDLSPLFKKRFSSLSSEEKQKLQTWLNSKEDALQQIILGNRKPYYWRKYSTGQSQELLGILMPNLGRFKDMGRALCLRANFSASDGKYDQAFDDIKSCYTLGQCLKGNRTLIEQLVAMAIENIACHAASIILDEYDIDNSLLTEFQTDFENLTADEDFTLHTETESLFMYDEIQRCFTGKRLGGIRGGSLCLKGLVHLNSLTSHEVLGTFKDTLHILYTHPDKAESIKMANDYWAFQKNLLHKTPAQIRKEYQFVDKQAHQIIKGNILLETLLPAISSVNEYSHRNKAEVDALITIISLFRYSGDKGQYPQNLNTLISNGYLKSLPIDPYSDKPLVYKKTEDNFILYSIGPNFKDENGKSGMVKNGEDKQKWPHTGDTIFWPVNED